MTELADYRDRYACVRMHREDGVLHLTLHTDGDSLRWDRVAHEELGRAFRDVAADRGNRVVLLTGAGDRFVAPFVPPAPGTRPPMPPAEWDEVYWEGKRLLMSLLDIEVPVVAAVNGPVDVHAELAVLADVVLASDSATFADAAHVAVGRPPGDGVQVVWPMLLGPNRGRYFLMTGQVLSAQEALALGVVAEVLPPDDLLPRAWELCRHLAAQPVLSMRYTRVVLTQQLRTAMLENLGPGLALQGLAFAEPFPPPAD